MRADEAAVSALDAQVGVPDCDELRDVALFVSRGAARVRPVHRQHADRQVVAAPGEHLGRDRPNELGRMCRDDRRQFAGGCCPLGHVDAMQSVERAVDGRLIALDHLGATAAVGLCDRCFDPLDCLLARHDPGQGEKAGLEDDVRPSGEADLAGDRAGVDRVDVDLLGEDLLLRRSGERLPHLVGRTRAVDQQRRAVRRCTEHVDAVEQRELMAADEGGLPHQIGAWIGRGPKRRWETVCEPDFFES